MIKTSPATILQYDALLETLHEILTLTAHFSKRKKKYFLFIYTGSG